MPTNNKKKKKTTRIKKAINQPFEGGGCAEGSLAGLLSDPAKQIVSNSPEEVTHALNGLSSGQLRGAHSMRKRPGNEGNSRRDVDEVERAGRMAEAGDDKGAIRTVTAVIDRLNAKTPTKIAGVGDCGAGRTVEIAHVSLDYALRLGYDYRSKMYANIGDLERAFDDATVLVRFAPTLEANGAYKELEHHLSLRIQIARDLGRFDCAVADAKYRLEIEDRLPEDSARLVAFQECSVLQLAKEALAAPERHRPHFPTENARRAFQKKAKIGPWAMRPFGCVVCGACDNLTWCSGCREVTYCSREHQKQHWACHKKDCKTKQDSRNNPVSYLHDTTRAEALAKVREKGYILMNHWQNPDVILLDPTTDQLYELVSGQGILCRGDTKSDMEKMVRDFSAARAASYSPTPHLGPKSDDECDDEGQAAAAPAAADDGKCAVM